MTLETERFQADVVVIGSGGAGLCAAAAAARDGARVVLVTKGRAGLANATAYAGGGFTVAPPSEAEVAVDEGEEPDRRLSPERHFELSLETGRGLNDRDLLRLLCDQGPRALLELTREFGVAIDWYPSGASVHRYGRPPILGGVGLTDPLLAWCRRAGVVVLEDTAVVELIAGPDGMVGVLALRLDWPPVAVEVHAPAVVVATGGGGSMYGRTDNPPRMTGDGYVLLRRLGAPMQDMEFVQFYPLGIAEPGMKANLLDASFLDHLRLTDENGREPLTGKLAEWGLKSGAEVNLYARDRLAVTLAREVAAGHQLFLRTDEVTADDLPPNVVRFLRRSFPPSRDPFGKPTAVAPTQHYFCGGALITEHGEVLDDQGRPVAPGLFACGEVTGGIDGANRVGGNALTNICVFGLAAGRAAGRWAAEARATGRRAAEAQGTGLGPAAGEWTTAGQRLRDRLGAWRAGGRVDVTRSGRPGATRPGDLRRDLNALCDRRLGPVRWASSLEETLGELERMLGEVPRLAVTTPAELLSALEVGFALETAWLVCRSAQARTESRGAHFRDDHPQEDPVWIRHVVVRAGGSVHTRAIAGA